MKKFAIWSVLFFSLIAQAGLPPVSLVTPNGSSANGGTCVGNRCTLSLGNATNPGLISSADWTTFNSKLTGPLTGDVTTVGSAATIANLAVTNPKIANATIDLTTKVTGGLPVANAGNALSGAVTTLTTGGNITAMPTATSYIRYNNSAATVIQGIAAPASAMRLILASVGTSITVENESSSATASNRISISYASNITLVAGTSIELVYDTTASRWVLSDFRAVVTTNGPASSPNLYSTISGTPSTSGTLNVILGKEAISDQTYAGSGGVLIGYRVGRNINGTPNNPIIIGNMSGVKLTGGTNTVIGQSTANNLTTGNSNLLEGASSATALTTGSSNVALGPGTLASLTTGSSNIGIGNSAGFNFTTGAACIAIGAAAGASVPGLTNAIAIGDSVRVDGSNQMVVGTASVPIKLGLGGVSNPQYTIDLLGDVNVSGSYFVNGVNIDPASKWSLSGNAGTTPITHYLGTSDFTDLTISANAQPIIDVRRIGLVGIQRISPDGVLHVGSLTVSAPATVTGTPTATVALVSGGAYSFGSGDKTYDIYSYKSVGTTNVYATGSASASFTEPAGTNYDPTGGSASDGDNGPGSGYDPGSDSPPSYVIYALWAIGGAQSINAISPALGSWSDSTPYRYVSVNWTAPAAGTPVNYLVTRNGSSYRIIDGANAAFTDDNTSWTGGTVSYTTIAYDVLVAWAGALGAEGYKVIGPGGSIANTTTTNSIYDDNTWGGNTTTSPTTYVPPSLIAEEPVIFKKTAAVGVGLTGTQVHAGGRLFGALSSQTNTGTADTNLFNHTIAANTFATDQDAVKFRYSGKWSASAGTKRVHVDFPTGNVIFDTGAIAETADAYWVITGEMMRTASGNQTVNVAWTSSSTLLPGSASVVDTTADDTSNNDFEIWGEEGFPGGSDILLKTLSFDFVPAN